MVNKITKHPKAILAFGDKEAIYTELSSPLSLSFASWFSIKNDMNFVATALTLLLNQIDGDTGEKNKYLIAENNQRETENVFNTALYRAAIVTYAKAFVSAKGRKQKLSTDIFNKQANLKPTHKELYDERNNYHAHAGISQNETLIPIIAFQKDNKNKHQLSTINFSVIFKNRSKLQEYIKVAKYVEKYAEKKANECGDLVYKQEIKNNIDELYTSATDTSS